MIQKVNNEPSNPRSCITLAVEARRPKLIRSINLSQCCQDWLRDKGLLEIDELFITLPDIRKKQDSNTCYC